MSFALDKFINAQLHKQEQDFAFSIGTMYGNRRHNIISELKYDICLTEHNEKRPNLPNIPHNVDGEHDVIVVPEYNNKKMWE